MKKKHSCKIVSLLFMATFFMCSCKQTDDEKETSEDAGNDVPTKTEVTTLSPLQQDIADYLQLNGVTLFQKKDNIRSNNTGYVTTMNFKVGDLIKSGETFCAIVTKEQQALKSIASNDSVLTKFQKPLPVFANGSGFITAINILQGDYVAEGDILALVSEPSSLVVVVNVPYEQHAYVSVGNNCEMILPDGKIINATISSMLPSVDAVSQSQSYLIRLPDQSLPENLNVTIRIPHKQNANTICVNSSVIQTDELQNEFWVMKLVNDSLAVKVPVQLGLHNDSLTEIISNNITRADKIINHGAYQLGDSSIVIEKK